MENNDELNYKLDVIINYLKEHGGYDYKVYDKLCPDKGEPDSNIVEYALDVKRLIKEFITIDESDLPF